MDAQESADWGRHGLPLLLMCTALRTWQQWVGAAVTLLPKPCLNPMGLQGLNGLYVCALMLLRHAWTHLCCHAREVGPGGCAAQVGR
jgi:hypothetical protein